MNESTGQVILIVASFVGIVCTLVFAISAVVRNNFTDFILSCFMGIYSINLWVTNVTK